MIRLVSGTCRGRGEGERALPAARRRAPTLREQEADLTRRLARQAHTPPGRGSSPGLADRLDGILANEGPRQVKELLRLLIKEIRVRNRRRIVPTYRVPRFAQYRRKWAVLGSNQ